MRKIIVFVLLVVSVVCAAQNVVNVEIRKYFYHHFVSLPKAQFVLNCHLDYVEIYVPMTSRNLKDSILYHALDEGYSALRDELYWMKYMGKLDGRFDEIERILFPENDDNSYLIRRVYFGKPIWIENDFVCYSVWFSGHNAVTNWTYWKHNYIFDTKTGRCFTDNEIFDIAKMSEFSSVISDKLKEIYGEEPRTVIDPTIENCHLRNIAFTKDSVNVVYNKNEIACGAMGTIEVDFSIEEVFPFLNKESVVYKALVE